MWRGRRNRRPESGPLPPPHQNAMADGYYYGMEDAGPPSPPGSASAMMARSDPITPVSCITCRGCFWRPSPAGADRRTGQRKARCSGNGIDPCPPCIKRGVAAACLYPQSRRVVRPEAGFAGPAAVAAPVGASAYQPVEAATFRCDLCNVGRSAVNRPASLTWPPCGQTWNCRCNRKLSVGYTNSVAVGFFVGYRSRDNRDADAVFGSCRRKVARQEQPADLRALRGQIQVGRHRQQ